MIYVLRCTHMTTTTNESNRATVTFHTSPETKARLDRLANITRRSKSFLTNEAVERYLQAEEIFVNNILQGIKDAEEGKVFTTDEVRAKLHASIDKVVQRKQA